MIRIGIIITLITVTIPCLGQIEELTPKKLKKNNINRAFAILKINEEIKERSKLESLEIRQYDFDEEGRCYRKKYIEPFYDVVTTSDEYYYKFDNRGNKIETINIHKSEGIREKDKTFIKLFKQTIDTTIFRYFYDGDNRLSEKHKIDPIDKDTFITKYTYEDAFLVMSEHFSSESQGKLHPENYITKYKYDNLGRLTEKQIIPKTLKDYSIELIEYDGNSERIIKELELNRFDWTITRDGNRDLIYKVEQDTVEGKMNEYLYNKKGQLINETFYRAYPNLESKYYGYNYTYNNDLLIEEQSFNKTNDVRLLSDKIKYLYNKEGFLIEEQMLYNGEIKYSYIYKYEAK
jgi:hypothetical protein